jgi:hypothetical protein
MNISFFFSMVQEVLVLNSVSSPGILWADLGPKQNVCEHKLEDRCAAPWVQFLPSLRQELPDRRRQNVNQQAAE